MKSFSELTSASYVSNSDILAISQENSGTYSSKKTTVKEVSDFANQNFAEEYDSTSSYAVGDYCIYESVLYKCTASTTGSFDSTKWTSVVVTDEMGSGGGGTGGHTIIDENGNSMTARAGLQFVGGVNVLDDATNNKTIVDISGGGGVYIEKTLWEDVNGLQFAPNNIQTITLSESLNKYDFIYVDVSSVADSGYHNQNILAVSSLYDENDGYNGVVCIGGNINLANSFAKVDNTHLKFIGFSDANPLIAWKVVGIKVSGDYFAPVIYSLEEREIGVWTDGKPLYEKTIHTGALSVGEGTKPHNISNFGTLINATGMAYYSGYVLTFPFVSIGQNSWNVGIGGADTNNIITEVGSSFTGNSAITDSYITLQYTKTTDVAGSGSWTPQGVPTHHYSTDEQVIGTYFGDTLYQKTIVLTSGVSIADSWTTIYTDALIGNIAQLVDVKYNNVDNKGVYGVLNYKPNGNNLQAIYPISGGLNVLAGARFTLKYTKSS